MAVNPSFTQRAQLALETRKRFVAEATRAMVELGTLVQERLTSLMNEAASSREMQTRRDAWSYFQKARPAWLDGTLKVWQAALQPVKTKPKNALEADLDGAFELVGTDVVENKILASRLVLGVMEKVSAQLNDLRVRMRVLDGLDELEGHDILLPEVLVLLMVEQWGASGMPRDSWPLVNDVVYQHLTERLKVAYTNCNDFLIKQGVLPTIDLKDRVKRGAPTRGPTGARAAACGRWPAPIGLIARRVLPRYGWAGWLRRPSGLWRRAGSSRPPWRWPRPCRGAPPAGGGYATLRQSGWRSLWRSARVGRQRRCWTWRQRFRGNRLPPVGHPKARRADHPDRRTRRTGRPPMRHV